MSQPPGPHPRVEALNEGAPAPNGRYVLYWMIAQRRTSSNQALERAVAWAEHLGRPLLLLEALGVEYVHASARFHAFVMEGMRDNASACRRAGIRYLGYVEPRPGAARGLIQALSEQAAVVVTDDHPVHPFPHLVERARSHVHCRFERVDACGLHPIRSGGQAFATAYAFRRHLQREAQTWLPDQPAPRPLARLRGAPMAVVPRSILDAWPELRVDHSKQAQPRLSHLPIDHDVAPTGLRGGAKQGHRRLRAFVGKGLGTYAEARNDPDVNATSGLSPYLHFGHVGAFEVFDAVVRKEGWHPEDLDTVARGKRAGWWGMSEPAEAFLDQLITWRELGFNTCVERPDSYDALESIPDWAQRTLALRATDPRPHLYTLQELEHARTHDEIWNAAQRQLRRDGTIHGYLRMLWGKKILEWSPSPDHALEYMIHLNDKFALDGRDPNSYAGILWCLGRYDRPWGPAREIFGTVRYMSSIRTRKKLQLARYLNRYSAPRGADRIRS